MKSQNSTPVKIDWAEMDRLAEENRTDTFRMKLSEDQRKFLTDYWYLLSKKQKMKIIPTVFGNISYGALQKRVVVMKDEGVVFKTKGDA